MQPPFFTSARSILAAALVCLMHIQSAEGFSPLMHFGRPLASSIRSHSIPIGSTATTLVSSALASQPPLLAKLGSPIHRNYGALIQKGAPPSLSSFSNIARHPRSSTALNQWAGTGMYLFTKWQVSLGLNSVLAGLLFLTGKYKKMLTTNGLFHAWILGVILWGSLGVGGWATGAFYLAAGSRVTKVKMAEKEAKGIAEGRGGARGPENVWGSAASAAICALLAAFSPWDSGIFKLGFVASLATKLSDTFASEIGKAYGKTTYLITSLERVEPGTEGAVSLEGTLAGVVGSLLLGLWGVLAKQIWLDGLGLCLVAAFVATTAESYIGATVQGKVPWMTNEVVNFINTAIGAVVAMGLFVLLRH